MLISSMFPSSWLGAHFAPYERIMWFAVGHLEREQRLNERALVAWCCDPHSYASWARAMQTASFLAPAALYEELSRLVASHAVRLRHQSSLVAPRQGGD